MNEHKPDDDVLLAAVLIDEDEEVVEVLPSNVVSISRVDEIVICDDEGIVEAHEETSLLDNGEVVVDTFIQKREQHFRAQSKSKKQRILISVAAVLSVILVSALVLESPFYDINKVAVSNGSSVALTEAEITQVAQSTQSLTGSPLYRVNSDSALERVKELPFVAGAHVKKSWPGTLVMTVDRRVPVAYIPTDKGFVYIDDKGVPYEKMEKAPTGVPTFEGIPEITWLEPLKNSSFLDVLYAAPVEIKNQIVRVSLAEQGTFDAVLSDGITIRLGQPDELDKKLSIAWSIILTKKRSELGYIDVSVPSLPVSGSPQLQL